MAVKTSRKSLFLVVVIASITTGFSQPFKKLFPDPINLGYGITLIDYDNDGDDDVLAHRELVVFQSKTILLRNDGNLEFTEVSQPFNDFGGTNHVYDMEGDGDPDLLICNYGEGPRHYTNTNGVFTQGGFGGFCGTGSLYEYTGDFDHDGDIDAIDYNDNRFYLYEKTPGGYTSTQLTGYITNVQEYAIPADFNNDGKVDLIITLNSQEKQLYISSEENFLRQDENVNFDELVDSYCQVFDIDADGYPEVLLSGRTYPSDANSFTTLVYKNSAGSFSKITDPFFEGNMSLVDLDEDNDLDIIKHYVSPNKAPTYYRNNGNANYVKIPETSPFYDFKSILSVTFSNHFDGDDEFMFIRGDIELDQQEMRAYRKTGDTYEEIFPNTLPQVEYTKIQWADCDQNGLMDVLAVNRFYPDYSYSTLLKNTGKTFEVDHKFDYIDISLGQWIDFNKDDKIDFVTMLNRDIGLFEGFEDGNVTSKIIIPNTEGYPENLKVVDFDSDGDNDVMLGGYMQTLHENVNGKFERKVFDPALEPFNVSGPSDWGDYDNDGDLDVVIQARGFDKEAFRIYRNDGTHFTDLDIEFPFTYSGEGKWLDYDQDDDLDVFILFGDISRMHGRLYRNNNGTFVEDSESVFENIEIFESQFGTIMSVVDFNSDGYPDVVVGGATEPATSYNMEISKIFFFKNVNGNFELQEDMGIPRWRDIQFEFADLESDGDPDLLMYGSTWNEKGRQIFINGSADLLGLDITTLTPKNNSLLPANANYTFTIRLNKPIRKGIGILSICRKSDNTPIKSYDINDPKVTINGNNLSVSTPTDIFEESDYYILCDAGIVSDFKGNNFSGINDKTTWNFSVSNTQQTQTIDFPQQPSVLLSAGSIQLNALSTSLLPISYTSSNPFIATVVGSVLVLQSAGSTTVTAYQEGNGHFKPATPKSIVIMVVDDEVAPGGEVVLGIEDDDNSLDVSPNPTSGIVTISASKFDKMNPISMSIQNTYGSLVSNAEITNSDRIEFSLTHLPAGVYILTLTQSGVTRRGKLVKQ